MKLSEAVQEFVCKMEDYKLLSKTLQENASTLNHSIDTIKDFIRDFSPANVYANLRILNSNISELSNLVAKISPGVAEDSVTNITDSIDLLHGKVGGFSNYVTKLDSIEKYLSDRSDFIHASDIPSANSDVQINKRLDQLESLCNQLNCKIDTLSQIPSFSQANIDNSRSHSSNQDNSHNFSRHSPNTCIILGDSNTKYVNINMHKFHNTVRVPTFTINDINPAKCVGYSKIWLHVGINSLKSYNCSNDRDVHSHFHQFINKLKGIQRLCPHSRIIISPILPTNVPKLNHRALIFNKLIFSIRENVTLLDFNSYCGRDGRLLKRYRCYNNAYDNIHLGAVGIRILEHKLIDALKHVDTRSCASVLRNNLR